MEFDHDDCPCSQSTENNVLLGRYKLGRILGRGAFAKVYYARSLIDGTSVAIKVISKLKIRNTSMEPRIIREISAMHRLSHPNIIRIHEVMATKTKIYIVMEYAQGGELLSEVENRGRLTECVAQRYFQQLVSALQYCHVNGVTHRDLKPQNLLLDHEGNLKISDFGLSSLSAEVKSKDGLLHTACGTPAYTAPEVIGLDGYLGTKSDAWSCGIVLYVLLAGHIPFDDSNIVVMYSKILHKELVFPTHFSKPVRHIISLLLDPNPDARVSIDELMNNAWLSLQSDTTITEDSIFDRPTTMNAFDIISMSTGMDLSGLLQEGKKQERTWTSTCSAHKVFEKLVEIGRKLGYKICINNAEKVEEGMIIKLVKGRLVLLIEILEVMKSSSELFLVKMKVIGGGELLVASKEDHYWGDWESGLKEIICSWHNDVD